MPASSSFNKRRFLNYWWQVVVANKKTLHELVVVEVEEKSQCFVRRGKNTKIHVLDFPTRLQNMNNQSRISQISKFMSVEEEGGR
jgi:hypothetical protein